MSARSTGAAEPAIEPVWLVAAVGVVLLVARLLGARYGAFYEGDEISIAAGVAGIARDNAAHLYRYGPQVGYYRLVQALSAISGGIPAIPVVMVTLSVLAGTVIPLLALFAFPRDLTRTERWLLAATLAANPILWTSSSYGNTAMPAAALTVAAVVILSNRPARRAELTALGLFAAAILVRADSVLATGAIGLLLWRNHGSFLQAAVRVAIVGVLLMLVYFALFVWDPYMLQITGDVQEHLRTNDRTRFFELLLWAISPLPLAYAILGLRDLEPSRRFLLATIAAWCVPAMGFYFTATTTPRYFILPAFPIAIAAAVGMANVARLLPTWRPLAWTLVLLSASLHLFVGLSNFYPAAKRGWLTDARTGSHDGDVLAGAFLYNSYVQNDVRNPGIRHPKVGSRSVLERSYVAALDDLSSGRQTGDRIFLLFSGGEGHAVHYFAQQAGATVIQHSPSYSIVDPVTYDIGGARLTAVGIFRFDGDTAPRLPVKAGDVVWLQNRAPSNTSDIEQRAAARMPPGLALEQRKRLSAGSMLWSYRVTGVDS